MVSALIKLSVNPLRKQIIQLNTCIPILGTDPSLMACTPSVAVVVVSGVDGFLGLSVYIVVFEGSTMLRNMLRNHLELCIAVFFFVYLLVSFLEY